MSPRTLPSRHTSTTHAARREARAVEHHPQRARCVGNAPARPRVEDAASARVPCCCASPPVPLVRTNCIRISPLHWRMQRTGAGERRGCR